MEHRIGNEADETTQFEPADQEKNDSHDDGGDGNRCNGRWHESRSIGHSGRDMGQQRGQNGDRMGTDSATWQKAKAYRVFLLNGIYMPATMFPRSSIPRQTGTCGPSFPLNRSGATAIHSGIKENAMTAPTITPLSNVAGFVDLPCLADCGSSVSCIGRGCEKAGVITVLFMVVGRLSPSSAVRKHNRIAAKSDRSPDGDHRHRVAKGSTVNGTSANVEPAIGAANSTHFLAPQAQIDGAKIAPNQRWAIIRTTGLGSQCHQYRCRKVPSDKKRHFSGGGLTPTTSAA